ncbi:MAG TPA: 16S rRNA processing protein RimM, partial [bacterium]|nr:16S rRNA processing protein RimM [bacterium]
DESGKKIGILADVETSPAHDLYVIEVQGKRYRIPAVAEFIKAINKETGVITIHLIPGLLEYQTAS